MDAAFAARAAKGRSDEASCFDASSAIRSPSACGSLREFASVMCWKAAMLAAPWPCSFSQSAKRSQARASSGATWVQRLRNDDASQSAAWAAPQRDAIIAKTYGSVDPAAASANSLIVGRRTSGVVIRTWSGSPGRLIFQSAARTRSRRSADVAARSLARSMAMVSARSCAEIASELARACWAFSSTVLASAGIAAQLRMNDNAIDRARFTKGLPPSWVKQARYHAVPAFPSRKEVR